jgi:hypothetical protein
MRRAALAALTILMSGLPGFALAEASTALSKGISDKAAHPTVVLAQAQPADPLDALAPPPRGRIVTPYDSWIDVFTIPGIKASSLKYDMKGQRQTIIASIDRELLFFRILRNTCAPERLCFVATLEHYTATANRIGELFESKGRNLEEIEGAGLSGARAEIRDGTCSASLVGIHRLAGGRYPLMVSVLACGDKARAQGRAYTPRIKLSSPEKNRLDDGAR